MVAYQFKTTCITKTLGPHSSQPTTHFLISEGSNQHMKKVEGVSSNAKRGYLVNKKEAHVQKNGIIQTHNRYQLNENSVLKLLSGQDANGKDQKKNKEKEKTKKRNEKNVKKVLKAVKKVPKKEGTSAKKVPKKEGTSAKKVPKKEGTSAKKVPKKEGTSAKKESSKK